MKLSNLMQKDFKLVEKKKIWFIIPACIYFVAIVAMIVWGFVKGAPLNLGMDFTGGYAMNVRLSTQLTKENYTDYENDIIDTIEGLEYGIKVSDTQEQGSGETAAIYIKYKAPSNVTEAEMEDINKEIQSALQDSIFKMRPKIESPKDPSVYTKDPSVYTLDYGDNFVVYTTFEDKIDAITAAAESYGLSVSDFKLDGKTVAELGAESESQSNIIAGGKKLTFNVSGDADRRDFYLGLSATAAIDNYYSGQPATGDVIGATVSGELLINAILAICLSIVLMLVYIAFRFEVSSGLSAIVALLHDVLVMFSFMAIFHIEISSTFIAALITILGYSINNTIIVFDRIRENTKSIFHKNSTATFIANTSVKETLIRSINTSVTTVATIAMVAIVGAIMAVESMWVFALPIIVGLLAGTFSSIFISPSVWALWKDRKKKSPKQSGKEKKTEEKVAVA